MDVGVRYELSLASVWVLAGTFLTLFHPQRAALAGEIAIAPLLSSVHPVTHLPL